MLRDYTLKINGHQTKKKLQVEVFTLSTFIFILCSLNIQSQKTDIFPCSRLFPKKLVCLYCRHFMKYTLNFQSGDTSCNFLLLRLACLYLKLINEAGQGRPGVLNVTKAKGGGNQMIFHSPVDLQIFGGLICLQCLSLSGKHKESFVFGKLI